MYDDWTYNIYYEDLAVFNGSGTDIDGNIIAYGWISDIDGIIRNEALFQLENA